MIWNLISLQIFLRKIRVLMKITYLSNTAIPSNVASSIQIVKMCEAFSLLDHDVNLITTNTSRIKSNIFEFYNVKKV